MHGGANPVSVPPARGAAGTDAAEEHDPGDNAAMRVGPTTCLITVGVAGLFLAVPIPSGSREVQALLDMAHAPTFALLAAAVFHGGRPWLPRSTAAAGVTAWALVVLFGGAMEVAQVFSGRHASWADAAANAAGAAASLAWLGARGVPAGPRRHALAAAAAALLAAPCVPPLLTLADAGWQAWDRPRLASFERRTELSRWRFADCRAARSREHATDAGWSLWLELGPGRYPSATLWWPYRDWSGHAELTFDVFVSPGPPLDLVVKVQGEGMGDRFEDRFHRTVRLHPGPQSVRVALEDVARVPSGRPFDLRRVDRFELFAADLRSPRVVYLDNLRLR